LCLGILSAVEGDFKLAEDYILDAAYVCEDPEILYVTGEYYLSIFNAEIDTAIAYFNKACEIQPLYVKKCDNYVRKFISERQVYYPVSLRPYLDMWETYKQKLEGKRYQQLKKSFNGEFADRLSGVLKIISKSAIRQIKHIMRGKY